MSQFKAHMSNFSIVVAATSEGGIGFQNTIPWKCKADMQHFRLLTSTTESPEKMNAVIMGRKTWDSLPKRPLPGRINIVLSRSLNEMKDTFICNDLDSALTWCSENSQVESVFVIGGAQIYQEALKHPKCKEIYLTEIKTENLELDRFVPELTDLRLMHDFKVKSIFPFVDPNLTATLFHFVKQNARIKSEIAFYICLIYFSPKIKVYRRSKIHVETNTDL